METQPIDKKIILYIGGFELPDKNAAAQRVIGIAKGLKSLEYEVIFLNSIKGKKHHKENINEYFGFTTIEYGRESSFDYLFSAQTALKHIRDLDPSCVIAYNYPAVALNRIRCYCKNHSIKCIADVTEWYSATSCNYAFRIIKGFDTWYRMEVVQKKLDGVIAISRYLYDYYHDCVKTVMIPPTVDISDEKWRIPSSKDNRSLTFVYAGSPSATKERLDLIVTAINMISTERPVKLVVVGITKEQFISIYSWNEDVPQSVSFLGRVDHLETLRIVRSCDWSIIIRDDNRVVKAGFPTKLVESISCGTPTIINSFSNVYDYINDKNGILLNDIDELVSQLHMLSKNQLVIDCSLFDYHNFLCELMKLI